MNSLNDEANDRTKSRMRDQRLAIDRILDAFGMHSIDLVGFYSDCEIVP